MQTNTKKPGRWWQSARRRLWMRRLKLGQRYEFILALFAVASVGASFIAITRDETPFDMTGGQTATVLFTLNLVLLLLLGVSVGRWFVRIWTSRKASPAAARLHVRITAVFMGIAVVPPIVMAIFSSIFLEYGLQTWFGERVRSTVDNSLQVAQSYIAENRRVIENDAAYLARYFSLNAGASTADLRSAAQDAIFQRSLNELLLIELHDGEEQPLVIVRANQGLSLGGGTSVLPREVVRRMREDGSYLATNGGDHTFISITRLTGYFYPTYLYIARDLNPLILEQYEKTLDAVEIFNKAESEQGDFQRQFNILYLFLAVLILLAAIWIGMWFSSRLVDPLSQLVQAAQRMGQGDLDARVAHTPQSDEIGHLSRSFNRMAGQLQQSQAELLAANQELDDRRRFVEGVLENVSAGVIGLDGDGIIFLPNRSAQTLLDEEVQTLIRRPLTDIVPEFAELLADADENAAGIADGQIEVTVKGDRRVLLVRIAREVAEKKSRSEKRSSQGYVVTFDDVTEQLADQRTAAWADVARRIAHEIKNPLTPIQLSAERLKRKYGATLPQDDTIFEKCTSTIIRQVGDLRRMVDEFSSFARMPAPLFKQDELVDISRHALFLQEVANPRVSFSFDSNRDFVPLLCDGRLIGQAITNIAKNAAESVSERIAQQERNGQKALAGYVSMIVNDAEDMVTITLDDNGLGLPDGESERLMDPYVTTRQKGTGLGLAIVKRIIEEHGGRVRLSARPEGGARVTINLSRKAVAKRAADREETGTEAAE